ncbi:hypothetical protein CPB97_001974 [Podila verticillata]|nr:hypothetical protein CPB97_001974 [Podila verticillata]
MGNHCIKEDMSNDDELPMVQRLDFTPESGMAQLAPLKNLESLGFNHTVQNMSAEDVAWISNVFGKLEHIYGKCNDIGRYKDQSGAQPLLE